MIETRALRRTPFATLDLVSIGTVRFTVDASWLPLGALLYCWLERQLMPALVPELDPAAYWPMALFGTTGVALVIVLKALGPALLAAWRGLAIELRLTPLGGAVLATHPLRLRDELLLVLASLVVGGLVGLALLIGWFKLADESTPLWLGGVVFFLGLAAVGITVAALLPAWPLAGGRLLRNLVQRRSGSQAWGGRAALGATLLLAAAGASFGGYWAVTQSLCGGALLIGTALLLGSLAWLGQPPR